MEDLVEVTNDSSAIYAMWGLFFTFLPVIIFLVSIYIPSSDFFVFIFLGSLFSPFLGLYFSIRAMSTNSNPKKKLRYVGLIVISCIVSLVSLIIIWFLAMLWSQPWPESFDDGL